MVHSFKGSVNGETLLWDQLMPQPVEPGGKIESFMQDGAHSHYPLHVCRKGAVELALRSCETALLCFTFTE